MGKVSWSVLKSVFLSLALASLILVVSPSKANAQVGTCFDPAVVGAVNTQGDEIVTELDVDHISLMETLAAGMVAMTSGLSKLDMDLTALGGTNTANSTSLTAVLAKATDSQAASANQEGLHAAQATLQVDAAAGSGAYQRNNLCQQATLQAGRSSVQNAKLTELNAYNGYRAAGPSPVMYGGNSYQGVGSDNGLSCTTCGGGVGGVQSPSGVIGVAFMKTPIASRIVDLAKAALPFFGSAEVSGLNDNHTWDTNSYGAVDDTSTVVTHLDVDPMGLSSIEELTDTYSDVELKAHDQLSNYFVGIPPDIITSAASFGSPTNVTPQYASAVLASREKIAFENLTAGAMEVERAYHNEVTTGAGTAVAAIYQAAGRPAPTYKNGVSDMAVDEALYSQAADDPNFASNVAGMNTKTLLEFIADEMLLLNRMEYKNYLQQMEMYKIQSASLNLQARTFNFSQNP